MQHFLHKDMRNQNVVKRVRIFPNVEVFIFSQRLTRGKMEVKNLRKAMSPKLGKGVIVPNEKIDNLCG